MSQQEKVRSVNSVLLLAHADADISHVILLFRSCAVGSYMVMSGTNVVNPYHYHISYFLARKQTKEPGSTIAYT